MSFFYTGKGDRGESHVGSKKHPKDSPIIEALGQLDELNSLIGWVRSDKGTDLERRLKDVQEALFIVQAEVARLLDDSVPSHKLGEEKVKELEAEIERIEETLNPDRGFIIPGAEPVSAQLDYLRTVARRAERRVFALHRHSPLSQEVLSYLNRLSSYFYALARLQVFGEEVKESRPKYE